MQPLDTDENGKIRYPEGFFKRSGFLLGLCHQGKDSVILEVECMRCHTEFRVEQAYGADNLQIVCPLCHQHGDLRYGEAR